MKIILVSHKDGKAAPFFETNAIKSAPAVFDQI